MVKYSKIIICLLILTIIVSSFFMSACDEKSSSNALVTTPTTQAVTEEPTTSASTDDTATEPVTWNYSKLKQKAESLTKDFDNIISKNKFRGTVYIKISNDFEYIGTNGFADKDKHKENSLNTCYRVASLTKQFTAVSVMQLKEKGKLSLDDKLSKYYPSYKYGKKITIKNLLTMTSGIRDYLNIDNSSDLNNFTGSVKDLPYKIKAENSSKANKKIIMDWIFSQKLIFEPDTEYMYSNSSYYILGDIIEKVSGKSYEKYVTDNILKPCGMISSGFADSDKLAKGYQDVFDSEWQLYSGVSYSAAGLISNVPDLLKWIDALSENSLISAESFDEMTTPYMSGYGYGFMINNQAISHTGKVDKYNSVMMFNKNNNQVAIALSNYAQSDPSNIFRKMFNKLSPYYG